MKIFLHYLTGYLDRLTISLGVGDIYCGEIHEKIAVHSDTKVAPLGTDRSLDTCLIFDEDALQSGEGIISAEIKKFCGVSAMHYRIFFLFLTFSYEYFFSEPPSRLLYARTCEPRHNSL